MDVMSTPNLIFLWGSIETPQVRENGGLYGKKPAEMVRSLYGKKPVWSQGFEDQIGPEKCSGSGVG